MPDQDAKLALSFFLEACASCAIEGNKWAAHMLELWKRDKKAFLKEYERVMEVANA